MGMKRRPNALHLSTSGERYTPAWLAEAARDVLGGTIELDPASSPAANSIIGARSIYTAKNSGLRNLWNGTVFLNAPGSCPVVGGKYLVCGTTKRCSCGLVGRFWDRLSHFVCEGYVPMAFWLGFQLGQLQTLQGRQYKSPLAAGPTCILKDRVRYLDENLVELPQPSHGGYVTLLTGDTVKAAQAERRFLCKFKDKGVIVGPC